MIVIETDLKSSTDAFSESIARIPAGGTVEILSSEGDWLKVRHSGKDGFVLSSFVSQ